MGLSSISRRGLTSVPFHDETGSVLLEAAFGIALIFTVALPFASLASYATYTARDLAAAQSAARDAARSKSATPSDASVALSCGTAASDANGPCFSPLARATYVAATKDTLVTLPFGLALHTNARGVARVE